MRTMMVMMFAISVIFTNCTRKQHKNTDLIHQISVSEKKAFVNDILIELQDNYINEALIISKKEILRENLLSVLNKPHTDLETLAEELTGVSRDIINDKHLSFRVASKLNPAEASDRALKWLEENHYGIGEIALNNDIGYLELKAFKDPRGSEPLLKKYVGEAFFYLNDAKALIIDLRNNGGGAPEMVATISSFILKPNTALNEFHWRDPKGLQYEAIRAQDPLFNPKISTVERINGMAIEKFQTIDEEENFGFKSKLKNVPVVILTSSKTFSAAEEFAYNLKQLKRAVIIGERTGGGANPFNIFPLKYDLIMRIPNGEAKNAISRDNWEKKGVEPDIEVPSDKALKEAINMLTKKHL